MQISLNICKAPWDLSTESTTEVRSVIITVINWGTFQLGFFRKLSPDFNSRHLWLLELHIPCPNQKPGKLHKTYFFSRHFFLFFFFWKKSTSPQQPPPGFTSRSITLFKKTYIKMIIARWVKERPSPINRVTFLGLSLSFSTEWWTPKPIQPYTLEKTKTTFVSLFFFPSATPGHFQIQTPPPPTSSHHRPPTYRLPAKPSCSSWTKWSNSKWPTITSYYKKKKKKVSEKKNQVPSIMPQSAYNAKGSTEHGVVYLSYKLTYRSSFPFLPSLTIPPPIPFFTPQQDWMLCKQVFHSEAISPQRVKSSFWL